jgi:hypothetical protein
MIKRGGDSYFSSDIRYWNRSGRQGERFGWVHPFFGAAAAIVESGLHCTSEFSEQCYAAYNRMFEDSVLELCKE